MVIGREKLMANAEAFMDFVDASSEERGTEEVLGVVMVIAEIRDPDGNRSWFSAHCSDGRSWVQEAVLTEAMDLVQNARAPVADPPDEDS